MGTVAVNPRGVRDRRSLGVCDSLAYQSTRAVG
jgi:hypothetical protein